MDFDTLIKNAWNTHHDDFQDVAHKLQNNVHLVENATQANQMASLALHLLGGHLDDWKGAAELIERAIGNAEENDVEETPLHRALGSPAAAQLLANQANAALQSEALAVEKSDDPVSTVARIRLVLAEGLAHAGRFETCGLVFKGALSLAEPLDDDASAVKTAAIVSNNIASELLEKPERDKEQRKLMLDAAQAAKRFWNRAGSWVNDERADYLLALVHNARAEYDAALEAGLRGLATIAANGGGEEVDQAFLNLQVFAATHALGDEAAASEALEKADSLADQFEGDGLVSWYKEERAKVAG